MLLTEMSRAYNLRTRTRTGVANQLEQDLNEPTSPIDDYEQSPNEVAPPLKGSVPNTEATLQTRLYSDVAASRPPSPRRERPNVSSGEPIRGPDRSRAAELPFRGKNTERGQDSEESSVEEGEEVRVETPDKPEYWTTVQRKRARSESSIPIKRTLTAEQTKAVERATEGMTAEQRKKVQIRQEKFHPRRDDSSPSREEGPSNLKGKTIDP